jgi:hypothetical protein
VTLDVLNSGVKNLIADKATIGQLNAANATIGALNTNIANVSGRLTAVQATIDNLTFTNAEGRYIDVYGAWVTTLLLRGNFISQGATWGARYANIPGYGALYYWGHA